jgi:phosphatidylinositol kinase/protein kinase (PI-3  family)
MNFENAPFKLTREYVEVLGGLNSPLYKQFEDLFMRGYFALQKHREALSAIVQLFYGSRGSKQADGIRQRLGMRGPQEVASLVSDSFDNSRTTMYDRLQKLQNGIQF